ncbi:BN159_2729 family protein [Streptomyces sp. NPDC046821]|uniref:BN159_2729 family protein n=1 Tax=Streptomyces sp. NPDC046821 TaxID=3154702 RepID=UPI0033C89E60
MTQNGNVRAASAVIRECFARFEEEVAVRLAPVLVPDALQRLHSAAAEAERERHRGRAGDTVVHRQALAQAPAQAQSPALALHPGREPLSALEAEAAAGETQCARVKSVWASLWTEFHGHRPEVMAIDCCGDRVVVCIKAASLADWYSWLAAIGAPVDAEPRQAGYAQLAFGRRDGVPVHLVAHDVPRLLEEAWDAACEPYILWGRVYDLSRPLTDRNGDIWHHHRYRPQDHVPLLRRRDRDELSPLTCLVRDTGPLTDRAPCRAPWRRSERP